MEFLKDEEEEKLHIERHLLLLLSNDDNQNSSHVRSNVSNDPLYLFKIVHGSCNCTNSSYSESQVHKIGNYAKFEMVHRVNKVQVLKPNNGNGTGVFIPEPAGHLSRRNILKQHI